MAKECELNIGDKVRFHGKEHTIIDAIEDKRERMCYFLEPDHSPLYNWFYANELEKIN